MATEVQKSWEALFKHRIQLIEAVKKGVEKGLDVSEKLLAEAEKQEALIRRETTVQRRDRVVAKKEFFGEEHEKELIDLYEKSVGKGILSHLSDDMKGYVRRAEQLNSNVSQEESQMQRILLQEQEYVERAKQEITEVVNEWKKALELLRHLPAKIENKQFLMTDQEIYTKLSTLFGGMYSKLQAIEQYEFDAEKIEVQAQKYDGALKETLEALQGLDMQEVKNAISARNAARRRRRST